MPFFALAPTSATTASPILLAQHSRKALFAIFLSALFSRRDLELLSLCRVLLHPM